MNRVIENLEYLVRRKDFVGVPSLGAFIADYRPAEYDENHALFAPPARIVRFNTVFNNNQDDLINSISRRERVSYAKAKRIVEEDVESIKAALEADGEVSLGSVGRLIRQPESTPIFEPSEALVGYETAYFSPIVVRPVGESSAEEGTAVPSRSRTRRVFRAVLRTTEVAAAVLIFFCVGIAVFAPEMFNRNDCLAMVSSNPIEGMFAEGTAQQAEAHAVDEVLTIAIPGQSVEAEEEEAAECRPAEEAPAEEAEVTETQPETPAVRINPADRYCIVVASMPSAALAEKFISQDGNPDLRYYATDGKYRVYAASAMTQDELYSQMAGSLGQRYPNGWVCRMN